MRFYRLAVVGDDNRLMASELETKNPRRRGVDQAKAEALAAFDCECARDAPVDCHRIADAARHGRFHRIVETIGNQSVPRQAEIAKHPNDIAINAQRVEFFHDKGSRKTAADLL